MKKNEKDALIKLMGGLGLILIIIPIFTNLYPFTHGLVLGLIVWILTGVVRSYLGVEKKRKK
jgi:hypothetical protein